MILQLRKVTTYAFSILISIVGLWYAFQEINFKEFWSHLSSVNFGLLFFAMGLMIFSVLIRAYRWKLILKPFENFRINPLFESLMVGYFGNSVLPFRIGEVLRGYSLSKVSPLTFSVTFGTIILERILDMLGLILLIGIFTLAMFSIGDPKLIPLIPVWMMESIFTAVIITVVLFISILIFGRKLLIYFNRIQNGHESLLFKKVVGTLINLFDGITSLKNSNHSFQIALQTIYLWIIYYACAYLITQAVNINIGWIGVGIVLIGTTLSITVPAAPGYIGTYHAVVVFLGTTLFAIPRPEAQAFAVIIHASGYLPFVILGAYYFIKSSVHISDIKDKNLV